jgi:hypothetical protein
MPMSEKHTPTARGEQWRQQEKGRLHEEET